MTPERLNVVVAVLDTARGLDTVPANRSLTPTFASLAAEGIEYRRAFASAPWTLPSHAGLLTGTYTSFHGTHGANPVLDDDLETLPEVFSANGYETRAVSTNTWISDEFGFDRGFDTFRPGWDTSEWDGAASDAVEDDEQRTRATEGIRAAGTTDAALDLVPAGGGDPFFLFVNYIDAHFAYAPPERYVRGRLPEGFDYGAAVDVLDDPRQYNAGGVSLSPDERAALRALYRGELAYLDDNLGRLVDGLRDAGVWEDTLLVVTSDHGENIGEHGFVGHQYSLYDTILHVPLVVVGGSFDRGRSSDRLVQLPDLPATIVDEVGIKAPEAREQFQGRTFHPDSTAPRRDHVIAEHVSPRPTIETLERRYGELPDELYSLDRSLPIRAIRTDQHKLVLGSDGSRSLYDLDADPTESEDVAERRIEVVDRLEEGLTQWLASFEPRLTERPTAISADSKERLRNLGYL